MGEEQRTKCSGSTLQSLGLQDPLYWAMWSDSHWNCQQALTSAANWAEAPRVRHYREYPPGLVISV